MCVFSVHTTLPILFYFYLAAYQEEEMKIRLQAAPKTPVRAACDSIANFRESVVFVNKFGETCCCDVSEALPAGAFFSYSLIPAKSC